MVGRECVDLKWHEETWQFLTKPGVCLISIHLAAVAQFNVILF